MKYYLYHSYDEEWQIVNPEDGRFAEADWQQDKDWFGDPCMIAFNIQIDRHGIVFFQ